MNETNNVDRFKKKYENKISRRKISFLVILIAFGILSTVKVDALIPVTYVCCQNYSSYDGNLINGFEDTTNTGVQLDDFENINNWTVGGTGASIQNDSANFVTGTQGLKLIATNGNKAFIDKVINNDFSNTTNFVVWVYVYNINTISYVDMQFTSSPTWYTAFYSRDFSSLTQGWNKLTFTKADFFTNNSNPENWSKINKTRLMIMPKSGMNTNGTFDNFRYNTTNDWIVGGSGANLQQDTTNFMEGKQSLKLTATNGTVSMDLPINNDFSNMNNFGIWAYIDNADNQNGMTLYLTSNSSNWNYYFYDTEWKPAVKTGWNHLIFNKHNFKDAGGENWNNIMKKVRLRIYPNNTNLSVSFDDIVNNIEGKRAKLMFQFDDGSSSTYNQAFPILNANNQSGTAFVVTKWLAGEGESTATDMNNSNLRSLQSAGWDISSHTLDHPDLTSLNDSSLGSELNDSYNWLVTNGFQKSAGFLAYPFGKFNDHVIEKAQQRYIFGRATYNEASQPYTTTADNTNQYIQRIIVTSNVSVPDIKDKINDSINAKLLSILLFHKINDTNPDNDVYTFLKSDFQDISNYVKSRSADTDVITYSDDYVIPQINSFTPVINKTTRIYSNGTSQLISKSKYDEYMPNMTIIPSSDYVDVDVSQYVENGGTVAFNESVNSNVTYNIGDRIPNKLYDVGIYWSNGSLNQVINVLANSTGYINYDLGEFNGSRAQIIGEAGRISLYNVVHQKYIYKKQDVPINFSLEGTIGTMLNVTVTSPNGNETRYNITMQKISENESLTYAGVNELGIYTVRYSAPNISSASNFEYKQKPVLAFVSASDLHYGYAGNNLTSGYTINRFISDINNEIFFPHPDFVALVGDTADTIYNIADSKVLYDTITVPYYITKGNHESMLNGTSFESIGFKGQTFYNLYGAKYNYMAYNYIVSKDDYTFIFGGVDGDYPPLTNYIGNSFGTTNYSNWLDNILAISAYKPSIAFSHYSATKPRDNGCASESHEGGESDLITRQKFEKYDNMPIEFSGDAHIVSKNVTNNITYVIDGSIINEPYVFDYIEIYPDKIQVHTIPYRLDTDKNTQYDDVNCIATDSSHTAENYSRGNPDENDFTIPLVRTAPAQLINLWNFTAKNISVDRLTLGNNNIDSGAVLVNLSPYEIRNILNMTINGSSPIFVNVTSFNSSGDVQFNESSPNRIGQFSYSIGDRAPNSLYSVDIYWTNGTLYQNFNIYSNNTGYINYDSTGFQDSRYQVIEKQVATSDYTVTLPAGYAFLRFNASNSTITNLDPDGQTNSQPFFNITNTGTVDENFVMYLNGTPTNITTYADLDNDFSSGKFEINASNSTVVVPSLAPGNSQNIWMAIDAIRAPPMNTIKNLTILGLQNGTN